MTRIISLHSFRGGTGKSNLTANLAALAALSGRRVAVIDTDIGSPGLHVLFGLDEIETATLTLNDFLWERCVIEEAAHRVELDSAGNALYVVPASLSTGEIARVVRDGYDVQRLNDGLRDLTAACHLDCLFIDTHPGLNEETLLSIAVSDVLVVVLRPDKQDYLGTAVTVEVARRLAVPSMRMLVNKAPANLEFASVEREVSETYGAPVLAVLPHSERLMRLSSRGLFCREYPDHPLTTTLTRVSQRLVTP